MRHVAKKCKSTAMHAKGELEVTVRQRLEAVILDYFSGPSTAVRPMCVCL